MKKSFNLESLIIPGFVLIILAFLTIAAFPSGNTQNRDNKKFVGVDAAGFKHYPNGDIERCGTL
ncbi:hypothetical protein [Chryseobacterium sp. JK1]|uniref:hypothetical protein n=1 Tax=Chryseobacterium sp. JK1 TaxID=874294 RepID=UPI003D68CCDB